MSTENGNGKSNGNGSIVLSRNNLISIGTLFAVLLVAVPVSWSFGIQWGELNSEVRRLRQDQDAHEKDNADDFKVIAIRLDKLERVSVNNIDVSNGGIDNVRQSQPIIQPVSITGRSVRSMSKDSNLLGASSGFDRFWSFLNDGWSDDTFSVSAME